MKADFKSNDKFVKIMDKYIDSSIIDYNIKAGVSGVDVPVGPAIGLGKTTTLKYSKNNSTIGDKADLIILSKLAIENKKTVVVQMDNFDLDKGFSSKELTSFFDTNRNIFQIKGIKWIFTVSKGVSSIVQKSTKSGFLARYLLKLEQPTNKIVFEILNSRNWFPLNDKMIKSAVITSNGILRDALATLAFIASISKNEQGKYSEDELLSYIESTTNQLPTPKEK